MAAASPAHLARPVARPRLWPLAVGARYTLRAMRWQPLVAGAALGAAMIGLSHFIESGLLGSVHLGIVFGTLATAVGAAFVLDDPAAATLVPVPVTLRRRTALRLMLAGLLLTLTLVGLATLAWERLAHLEMTGQAAGLTLVAIAGSVLAGRLAGWQRPGVAGAATVTALVAADALGFLPGETLFTGGAPVTYATATLVTWTGLATCALVVTAWATSDPAQRLAYTRTSAYPQRRESR